MDHSTLERLTYIKSVHQQADALSQESWPQSTTAILLYHDAVELFFQCKLETEGESEPYRFMDNFSKIHNEFGITLEYKDGIKRLNNTRNELKHRSLRPEQDEIATIRVLVNDFFEANTPLLFDIAYDQISMAALIEFEAARAKLREAEHALADERYGDGICAVAAAYLRMNNEFEKYVTHQLDHTPYPTLMNEQWVDTIDGSIDELLLILQQNSSQLNENVEKEIADIIAGLHIPEQAIREVYQILRIMTLGIDYGKYIRFNSITPNVSEDGALREINGAIPEVSEEELQFCIDFVIEVGQELQQSNVDLSLDLELNHTPLDEF
ncbi:hypothetical protein ACFQL9_13285 [Halobaculum lipolyticum]|uniref:DUF4145 domain-containing protein n=1 Tax=Halobaculum lipolyticum TaxID=3032001 RepID=A0ABD5WH12_9EURY